MAITPTYFVKIAQTGEVVWVRRLDGSRAKVADIDDCGRWVEIAELAELTVGERKIAEYEREHSY